MTEIEKKEIKTILELLRERLAKTKEKFVVFYFNESANIPILKDKIGLKEVLNTIKRESKEKILWEEKKGLRGMRVNSAGADPFEPLPVTETTVGIEIRVENPSKLDEYFEKVLSIHRNSYGSEIKHIEIYNPEDGSKAKIIINENYSQKPIQVKLKDNGYWEKLYQVAENGSATCENEDQAINVISYFNTNNKCPLYSHSNFKLSKILKQIDDSILPADGVKIEKITRKKLTTKTNLKVT